jgi:ornithine cyclodeaminase/alanine dehydrogenase
VRRVRVHSPRPSSRAAYASELGDELGLAIEATDDAASATAGADLVLCATQTNGEVALRDGDAGPAGYISSVSSTLPVQRELDEATIVRAARVIVDTPDALGEAGDMIAARAAGLDETRLQLLSEHLAASRKPEGLTEGLVVYKSIGSVEQDLALATAVWRAAEEQDRGQVIDPIERRKEPPQR